MIKQVGKFMASKQKRAIPFVVFMMVSLQASAQTAIVEEEILATKCKLVSNIEKSSGYGKRMNWMGEVKKMLSQEAENMGATHVVIKGLYPIGSFNGIGKAAAYKCE